MQAVNSVVKAKKYQVKNKISKLPREFRNFEALINNNIEDNIIANQIRKDASNYDTIKIELDNPSIAVIIPKKKTHTDLAQYLYAACFPPVRSTFLKAINKNDVKKWPGLTPYLMKHLPTSISTVQGHLHQEQQQLQSISNKKKKAARLAAIKKNYMQLKAKSKPGQSLEATLLEEMDEDNFPDSPTPNDKINNVVYIFIDRDELCTTYTDLTGLFPCCSSRGNEYLLIAYHYDGNCVIAQPLKNRTKEAITAG